MIELPLDQNFPEPLLNDLASWLDHLQVKLVPIRCINYELTTVDDQHLVIALYQLGYRGLITNDHHMLKRPKELAAILKTKLSVLVIKGSGHHPVKATGALLLSLSSYVDYLESHEPEGQAKIFQYNPRKLQSRDAWELFSQTARQRNEVASELYSEVKVSDEELAAPIL